MKLEDKHGASKNRSVSSQYGFGYVWGAQEVGTVNAFIEQFKLRLTD